MPPRKRFRRYRRKKHKLSNNDAEHVQINQITTPIRENNSLLESDDSASERTIIEALRTPSNHIDTSEKQWNNEIEITTPVNSNNHHGSNQNAYNTVTTPVNSYYTETTPVNKNCTPKRRHGSLNVTNLNVLFTSNVTYNDLDQLCETPTLTKDKCVNHQINQNDISTRKHSSSSMPKLHCSDEKKSLHVDHSTQTTEEVESEQVGQVLEKRCNEVYDTPRNTKLPCFSRLEQSQINIDKKPVIYGNEININPYLKSVECYLGKNVDSSFPEIFFSPKLLENKLSSTPIEKSAQRKPDPTSIDVDINNGVFNFSGHILSPNLKMNSFVGDKVKHKEDSIRDFRLNVSRKRSFTISPKSLARVSKLNRTRRSIELSIHMDRSICAIENQENFFTRLRRYGRLTRTWSSKVISLCHRMGLELKNSLQSLCNAYGPGNRSLGLSVNKTNDAADQCNKCVEYKAELDKYAKEIETNRREIESNRREIENNKNEIETEKREKERLCVRIEQQQDELVKLTENLKEIQNQLRSRPPPAAAVASFPPPPPPPPCLPPPPPPPLPPLPLAPMGSTSLKITKKERNSVATNAGQARPVISLEDILKVKLKKASDRCSATPTGRFAGTRRSSAAVSAPLETLEQVHLRPTPRIGGTLSEGGPNTLTPGSGDHAPTSPMTAMCRMLKADTAAVHRLKRLRRVGGYSCDSVYRRSSNEWREREL